MKLVISEQSIIIGKYRDSLANFALDYGSAAPTLVHPQKPPCLHSRCAPLIPRRGTWSNIWRAASLA